MSRGATARLFVAVDPPVRARDELAGWARRAVAASRAAGASHGSLRLLDADSLHLTLCFLGSRPVGEIDALAELVGAGAEHACELSVGAPLWLPSRRPRALAVEVHDRSGGLGRLQERLSLALASAGGWEPQPRRFRPHITLARVRGNPTGPRRARPTRASAGARVTGWAGGGAPAASSCEQPLPATPQLAFTPPEVVLYRSWLAAEGASYEALARGALELGAR